MEPPPPPESPQPGGRPRRPASGSPHRRAPAAPQPFAADRRGSVSATSEIEVEDVLDGISLASSTSERHDNAPEQRQRSLSFDDLYSLAPVQGGFTGESKFAFVPLEGDPMTAVKRSASNDDLQALAQAAMQDEQDMVAAEQDFPDDESVATVHSMPAVSAARDLQRVRRSRRKGTSLDGDGDADQDLDSFSAVHSEKSGGSETESPAERLFGKTRARELRQRIARGRNVTPQAASEALDAATAAIMGSESSETIEFVTWFSVWLLLMFWLLFYSSYGPMLWRFLYGPMGLVLCLPFGFALLFWLMAYTFSAFND